MSSCVLAKIQMVTKLFITSSNSHFRCVLAKIQMVTKLFLETFLPTDGCVLAKIQMVTKPQKYISIFFYLFKTMVIT